MKRRQIVGKIAGVASGFFFLNYPAAMAGEKKQEDNSYPAIPGIYDVRKYGATGNGKTNDAGAIQKAIDTCSKNGGGVVKLDNGVFLSGGISFKNNVELHLTSSAVLLGSPDLSTYNKDKKSTFGEPSRSFIYAADCHHIALTGTGKIDGQGHLFKSDSTYSVRPLLIQLRDSQDVRINDLLLTNSAVWACWLLHCERVKVDGVRIDNPISPNRDGIDIDGCREVHISNCNIKTEDDSIAFKVSRKGQPTRDVVITNCLLSSRCAAIRFGPDAIDNIENVTISNCVIRDTRLNGIKIQESMGGIMRNITFSNIVMENTRGPISIRLAGWKLPEGESAPFEINDSNWQNGQLQNILFDNIRASTPKDNICMSITGTTKTRPRQLTFSNIDFSFTGGGTAAQGARRNVPDLDRDYPEMYIFGELPAYGLYIHHASGIVLNNIHFRLDSDDLRPAIVCDDVTDMEISGLKVDGSKNAESAIRLQNSQHVFINHSRATNEIGTFLRVEGAGSKDILLTGNKLNFAAKIYEVTADVAAGAVTSDKNYI